jgi:hypothetical protein
LLSHAGFDYDLAVSQAQTALLVDGHVEYHGRRKPGSSVAPKSRTRQEAARRKGQRVEALRLQDTSNEAVVVDQIEEDVTEWDQRAYLDIVSTELTPERRARIVEPPEIYPRQTSVLAIHWHPEFVPLELIMRRLDATFPNRRHELVIPTQHNVMMCLGGYCGVEVDCFSRGFNCKVQLLAHFSESRLDNANVLRAMLAHTFQYRSGQLFEFIDSILDPRYEERIGKAAAGTGASEDLVRFVRIHTAKLKRLIDRNEAVTMPEMIKNRLVRHYFDALRELYGDSLIGHAQIFLQAVKMIVKAEFKLSYFYRTEEIIEEVRSLGGGVVVPHPEHFWPILLADYDVDGIEVWNPQSRKYTEFLINVVHRQNKTRRRGDRPLLIFMGDDTHYGEKALSPRLQDEEKAGREVGVQPAWDDLAIRKSLIIAGVDRRSLIEEYRGRLD